MKHLLNASVMTFEDFGLTDSLLKAIREMDFIHPTPVQEKVIPVMLDTTSDVIGLAQTGTGKTAAFGLPLVQQTDTTVKEAQTLILCPTRELCIQITNDLVSFSKYIKGLRIVAIYGGASIETQLKSISKGVHIIVATPGRMIDIMERKKINIHHIRCVILDEADEMLNMGFREDLDAILSETPAQKRSLMFSATMSKEIAAIASDYMHNPVEIVIGRRNEGAENVKHICYLVQSHQRYLAMKRIIDSNPDIYALIFCRTRHETKEVAENLIKDGYNADALHGDLSQVQRDHVMNRFRIRNLQVLVATDVAARGIDVDNITHVINYNLPDELDVYTHRSGRTARAGKKGTSVVIVHGKEQYKIRQLEKLINKKIEQRPVPGAKEICEKQLFTFIDKCEKMIENAEQIEQFLPVITAKLSWLSKEDLIKRIVSMEFSRLLAYYKNAEDLNFPDMHDSKTSYKRHEKMNFTRFFINIGKTDGIDKPGLIGVINDNTEDRSIELGRIDLMRSFSFFEAPDVFTDKIINAFQNTTFQGRKLIVDIAQEKNLENKKEKDRESSHFVSKNRVNKDRKRNRKKDSIA